MGERPDDEMLTELKAQTGYLREIASSIRREDLAAALDDPDKRRAYELSDGHRSSRQVVDDGNISAHPRTVQRWWKSWVEAGLARRSESGSVRARYDASAIDAGADDD